MKVRAHISLKEWHRYQNGEEATAYHTAPVPTQYLDILIDEKELIEIEEEYPISFTIKKTI